jgi:hypothetical protein
MLKISTGQGYAQRTPAREAGVTPAASIQGEHYRYGGDPQPTFTKISIPMPSLPVSCLLAGQGKIRDGY